LIRPKLFGLVDVHGRLSVLVHAGRPLRTLRTSSDRHQRDMPPKKKAEVFEVDGVACSVTSAKDQGTAYVKIGTSGFSHDQRITFRLSQLPGAASREEQVRAHKGWPALLAASRSKGVESGGGSAQPCARESLEASAGERPASSGCVACEGDDCEAALNSTDGRFYCEECVDDLELGDYALMIMAGSWHLVRLRGVRQVQLQQVPHAERVWPDADGLLQARQEPARLGDALGCAGGLRCWAGVRPG
jgi:hypothetical protein